MERGGWKTNTGFLLAAIGSAVGLGNIWRFSYMCYKNGGGAFLIPYLIALLACGIPLMILEFAIGHKFRASAPKSMHAVNSEWEWLGWWPVLFVMFGIELYYCVVIAWFGLYAVFSLKSMLPGGVLPWTQGGGPEDFFFNSFLGLTDGPFTIGAMSLPIIGMTVFVWLLLWAICVHRVEGGVERACKIFMPLLFLLTAVLVVWGLTLDGAGEGIKQYLQPDWTKLGDVTIWRDAFGQIFFSLSIGFGIMIAYASYLPKQTNLVRSAFITCLCNCGFSVFAGFAVFSVLGFMALQQGVDVGDVAKAGPGLCFVTYPQAIALLPAFKGLFGFLFFFSVFIAGITSAMSIIEAFASAAIDKFDWNRTKVVTATCILGLAGSLIFTTGAGLFWLDIIDHFLNSYGLMVVGLLEAVMIGWYYRIDHLHFHLTDANQGAYPVSWDIWWEWSVKFVAPVALGSIVAWSIMDDLKTPYEGYPTQALVLLGLGWVIGTFLLSGIFSMYSKHTQQPDVEGL